MMSTAPAAPKHACVRDPDACNRHSADWAHAAGTRSAHPSLRQQPTGRLLAAPTVGACSAHPRLRWSVVLTRLHQAEFSGTQEAHGLRVAWAVHADDVGGGQEALQVAARAAGGGAHHLHAGHGRAGALLAAASAQPTETGGPSTPDGCRAQRIGRRRCCSGVHHIESVQLHAHLHAQASRCSC